MIWCSYPQLLSCSHTRRVEGGYLVHKDHYGFTDLKELQAKIAREVES